MNFCPSCGGITEIPAGMHVHQMHDRLCRCTHPLQTAESVPPSTLTEEQVRALVREEVAKALADVKQETVQDACVAVASVLETPSVPTTKQARMRTGGKSVK